jgi:hypothetical protein
MRLLLVGLIVLTLVLSCASGTKILTQVDALSTTGTIKNDEKNDYVSVLAAYTAEFAIPNPLFGEAESSTRRFDPNHQNLIVCKATLLDVVSTAADIKCQ